MSTQPVLDRVVAAIDTHLVDNAAASPLLAPFAQKADGVLDAEVASIRADAERAIADDYQPALRRFKAFIGDTYRTRAENSLATRFDAKDFHSVVIDNGSPAWACLISSRASSPFPVASRKVASH